jgi:FG-GAP-like repeat
MRRLLATCAVLLLAALPLHPQILLGPPLPSPTGVSLDGYFAEADFDGDGLLDLLATTSLGSSPRLTFGEGTGLFAAPVLTGLPGSIKGLGAADLDGDGLADALTATVTSVTRWLGQGDAGFDTPQTIETGGGLKTMRAADLDLDGALDVVVTNEGAGTAPGRLTVLRNAGDGALVKLQELATNGWPDRAEVGDVNQDGVPDVLAGCGAKDGSGQWLFLYAGLSGAQFAAPTLTFIGPDDANGRPSVALANLVGGEALDVAVADYEAGVVRVLRGDGEGAFAPHSILTDGNSPYPFLRAGDLDGDGWPELVLFNRNNHSIAMWPSAGGTGFEAPQLIKVALDGSMRQGVIADLDADGRADLLSMHGGTLTIEAAARVLLNQTYAPGGPLLDLGHFTPGYAATVPVLLIDGTFAPGSPLTVSVLNVQKDVFQPGLVPLILGVVGTSVANLPFKGTLLVPAPQIVLAPAPVDASGNASVSTTWPAGVPSGTSFVLQFLVTGYLTIPDWAAINATQVTTP